jgi:hypothetical protein
MSNCHSQVGNANHPCIRTPTHPIPACSHNYAYKPSPPSSYGSIQHIGPTCNGGLATQPRFPSPYARLISHCCLPLPIHACSNSCLPSSLRCSPPSLHEVIPVFQQVVGRQLLVLVADEEGLKAHLAVKAKPLQALNGAHLLLGELDPHSCGGGERQGRGAGRDQPSASACRRASAVCMC